MMLSILVLSLAGCFLVKEGDFEVTGDPFALAYGDCVRTHTTTVDGAIVTDGIVTYDGNGDQVEQHVEYVNTGSAIDIAWEYGAPHEPSRERRTWSDDSPDEEGTFEWAGGHQVHEEWNYDDDRAVDYVEDDTYDGPLLIAEDTDSDGDGVLDSQLDVTWEAAEGGFVGRIEVELADDFASGELRADARGRLLAQDMSYESGTDIVSVWSGYNDLGNVEIEDITFSVLGESDDNERREYVLDHIGRIVSYTYEHTVAEAGEKPVVDGYTVAYTWDCP